MSNDESHDTNTVVHDFSGDDITENPLVVFSTNLVELCAEFVVIVEWWLDHDGECLADNPGVLKAAKAAIANRDALLRFES